MAVKSELNRKSLGLHEIVSENQLMERKVIKISPRKRQLVSQSANNRKMIRARGNLVRNRLETFFTHSSSSSIIEFVPENEQKKIWAMMPPCGNFCEESVDVCLHC